MPLALELAYQLSDADGDRGYTTIKLPNGFSLSQYTEFGAAMAELIDGLVGGRVDAADLCLNVDLSGLSGNVVVAGSDVEEIAAFKFSTSEGRNVVMNVPAMSEAVVGVGSDELNQADPFVAPLITAMETGIAVTGGTISPCDVGEDDIVSTVFAREKFRSSGKRR